MIVCPRTSRSTGGVARTGFFAQPMEPATMRKTAGYLNARYSVDTAVNGGTAIAGPPFNACYFGAPSTNWNGPSPCS